MILAGRSIGLWSFSPNPGLKCMIDRAPAVLNVLLETVRECSGWSTESLAKCDVIEFVRLNSPTNEDHYLLFLLLSRKWFGKVLIASLTHKCCILQGRHCPHLMPNLKHCRFLLFNPVEGSNRLESDRWNWFEVCTVQRDEYASSEFNNGACCQF